MKRLSILGLVSLILTGVPAAAEWNADPGDKVQVNSEAALAKIHDQVSRSAPYFEQAYGYAVFPSITRFGFGFGGAYGKGIVIEGDRAIGTTKYWQFTSGIQAGVRNFSMIIFFKDRQALEYYQSGNTQFMGQAGLAVGTLGVAGTPAYNDGVAVVTLTRMGLMGEFTISGAKFTYKPISGQ